MKPTKTRHYSFPLTHLKNWILCLTVTKKKLQHQQHFGLHVYDVVSRLTGAVSLHSYLTNSIILQPMNNGPDYSHMLSYFFLMTTTGNDLISRKLINIHQLTCNHFIFRLSTLSGQDCNGFGPMWWSIQLNQQICFGAKTQHVAQSHISMQCSVVCSLSLLVSIP